MIWLNGREINLENLKVKAERRRIRGLFPTMTDEADAGSMLPFGKGVPGGFVEVSSTSREALALHGIRLEPPTGFRVEGKRGGRLGRTRKKLINSICGGYLQQQEHFNEMAARGVDAAARAFQSTALEKGGMEGSPWLFPINRREALSVVEMQKILAMTRGGLFFLGLPGMEAYEKVLEEGRLIEGMDWNEEEVFRYQASFLPASLVHLADLARLRVAAECGVIVVSNLEELGCDQLCLVLEGARRLLPSQGELWICLGGRDEGEGNEYTRLPGADGLNLWTTAFLVWLMGKWEFQMEEIMVDENRLLRGKRKR